jgi:Tol biopolymer transport system component
MIGGLFGRLLAATVAATALLALLIGAAQAWGALAHGPLLAWVAYRLGDAEGELMAHDLGVGVTVRLVRGLDADPVPAWKPDGTRIAFIAYHNQRLRLYGIPARGGLPLIGQIDRRNYYNVLPLTPSISVQDSSPVWNHRGDLLLFTSIFSNTTSELYTIDSDGITRRLTNNTFYDGDGSWSHDDSQIAFVRGTSYGNELYIMRADGQDARQVTANAFSETHPVWHPHHNDTLVFVGLNSIYSELYLLTLSDDSFRQLTFSPRGGSSTQPAWSADGRWVVFVRRSSGNADLYLLDMTTGQERPLLIRPTTTLENYPAWIP